MLMWNRAAKNPEEVWWVSCLCIQNLFLIQCLPVCFSSVLYSSTSVLVKAYTFGKTSVCSKNLHCGHGVWFQQLYIWSSGSWFLLWSITGVVKFCWNFPFRVIKNPYSFLFFLQIISPKNIIWCSYSILKHV